MGSQISNFSLGVAASPLQIINVFEASHYRKVENLILIILPGLNDINKKQIDRVLSQMEFQGDVLWLYPSLDGNGEVEKIRTLLNFKRKIKEFNLDTVMMDNVFVGHIGSIYQCSVVNLFNDVRKIYVDDGTRSIDDIHFVNKNGFNAIKYCVKNFMSKVFLGVRPFPVQKEYLFFTFFYNSFFNLKSHLTLLPNKFVYTKGLRQEIDETSNLIAFVGQSLVDLELVSFGDYIRMLEKIDSFLTKDSKREVIYYAHRNESDKVLKAIEDKLDWRVVRNELPLELHFIFNERPIKLGLFFSSVTKTISTIFDEDEIEIISFRIPEKCLGYRREEIKDYYENLALSGIEIVDNFV